MNARNEIAWRVVIDQRGEGFRWGQTADEVVADWRDVLTIRASLTGDLRACEPAPGASPDLVEKVSHGVAAAFLRSLAGKRSLHASAVVRDGSSLACVGSSGSGKSTLSAELCRAHTFRLLADDIAAIDRLDDHWSVQPSETRHWLILPTDDSRNTKISVDAPAADRSAPLRCIVSLLFDDACNPPQIRPLHGARAAAALVHAMVRFESTPPLMKSELEIISDLARRVPVYELSRSRIAPIASVTDTLLSVFPGPLEGALA